ncbi:YgjP-like metallopeptidase domain-containing protein [Rhodoferax sp.]|uniref:YgjP-like metallopeptidase domain-containing protein n=1 Tax=Rhodoferax sp. TaxID=50421 RepID=UPI0025DEAB0A|nr:YgjP-like metallopeptidase domain-containing protein [Rhodoferax sp.]
MVATPVLRYLNGYPADTLAQVQRMLTEGRVGEWMLQRHPQAHGVRTDKVLYDYVQDLKADYLRSTEPLSKVAFDSKLHVVKNALGTHTTVSRVQGSKLKSKREIRVASLFKDTPEAFLKMIVVHELAHLREREHDKAFYKLCTHMEPAYHQLEFEVRIYLTHLEATGERLWAAAE